MIMEMFVALWAIMLKLSPWLLLGAGIAGLLHVFIPKNFIQRELRGFWGVVKAVLLGVPLPLCSCGVIPTGLGLRQQGASRGATTGFLISTPQTGVDSILVSASLLGWPFAIFKVLSALLTGLVGGFLADWVEPENRQGHFGVTNSKGARPSLYDGVTHGLQILQTVWRWLIFGIVVSAAIGVFAPESWIVELGAADPWLAMLGALMIGLPLYVCATASVPIAAALIASGLPTGAALVFLMAGPATNVATVGAVYRGLGKRVLGVYLATIVIGSVSLGLLFDSLFPDQVFDLMQHTHESTSWWITLSAVVLSGLLAKFALDDLRQRLPRRMGDVGPSVFTLQIEGMKCGGCSSRLQKCLMAMVGVESAEVTFAAGQALVKGTMDELAVVTTIVDAGFKVTKSRPVSS
ncbi:MAG: permease [Myxococcota bacterium]|nr:permease [Myxococcota bacterium]